MTYAELAVVAWVAVILHPAVALCSYTFGWWWRGRWERKRQAEKFDWRSEH